MYCSKCGKEVSGKFCTYCGTPILSLPEKPHKIKNTMKKVLGVYCLIVSAVSAVLAIVCFTSPSSLPINYGSREPSSAENLFIACALIFAAILFGFAARRLLRKGKSSVSESSAVSSEKTSPGEHNDVQVEPEYIQANNVVFRTDGKVISDEEVPYLIESGKKQAFKDDAKAARRSAKEDELSFQFFHKHGAESQRKTNVFLELNRAAYSENDIDKKINLLQDAITAYENAKEWHYNYSKGAMIYFQDIWEHMHNSRNPCFAWDESVRSELAWQIEVRDVILPWIFKNAQNGFMQTEIYREFPSKSKEALRREIDTLVAAHHLLKTKKGNSYFITANTERGE